MYQNWQNWPRFDDMTVTSVARPSGGLSANFSYNLIQVQIPNFRFKFRFLFCSDSCTVKNQKVSQTPKYFVLFCLS
jgi:hypothetical protein